MRQIEIEHLRYTYPGAAAPTLRDVSLQVEQGDFANARLGFCYGKMWMVVDPLNRASDVDDILFKVNIPKRQSASFAAAFSGT